MRSLKARMTHLHTYQQNCKIQHFVIFTVYYLLLDIYKDLLFFVITAFKIQAHTADPSQRVLAVKPCISLRYNNLCLKGRIKLEGTGVMFFFLSLMED